MNLYLHQVFSVSDGKEFKKLKRKKWYWQFLVSGEGTDSPMNQWILYFNIGHTHDKMFWALQQKNWNNRIVVICKLEKDDVFSESQIAQILFEKFNYRIDILYEMGEIKLSNLSLQDKPIPTLHSIS